ncbi:MAG: adenylyl-sulfate kinase [Actinomycetota bacterium]
MTENVVWHEGAATRSDREQATGGAGTTVWLTGLSGSGKSTIAYAVEELLVSRGRAAYVLDGDNLRHGINSDLGFSKEDRSENIRRVGEIARLMADAGLVVLVPVISPYESDRAAVRAKHQEIGITFIEVFVDTPLEVCEDRDPKGLYARARAGEITGMTGIDDPYEPPAAADVRVEGSSMTVAEAANSILAALRP